MPQLSQQFLIGVGIIYRHSSTDFLTALHSHFCSLKRNAELVSESGWLFSPVSVCGVSEVSSFLSVPPLPCLLNVNSARENKCMPGTLLPPHQTCPLPSLSLRLYFTMIHTVASHQSCSHMQQVRIRYMYMHTYLLRFRKWEKGGEKLEASPSHELCSAMLSFLLNDVRVYLFLGFARICLFMSLVSLISDWKGC